MSSVYSLGLYSMLPRLAGTMFHRWDRIGVAEERNMCVAFITLSIHSHSLATFEKKWSDNARGRNGTSNNYLRWIKRLLVELTRVGVTPIPEILFIDRARLVKVIHRQIMYYVFKDPLLLKCFEPRNKSVTSKPPSVHCLSSPSLFKIAHFIDPPWTSVKHLCRI